MATSESAEKTLFSQVLTYFESNDWRCNPIEKTLLQIPFQGENGEWMCYAQINEELENFCFFSIAPLKIPESQRPTVAEFITRINYGMMIGHFGLDFRDGELYYKTSLDVENGNLSASLITRIVYVNVLIMDEYLPTLMKVAYGQVSSQDAVKNQVKSKNLQKQKRGNLFSGLNTESQ